MANIREVMLTTKDNPYNPFTQFDDWYAFDVSQGYNTCALLARLAMTSYSLTDKENQREIEAAIDSIINNIDVEHIYKKVYEDE